MRKIKSYLTYTSESISLPDKIWHDIDLNTIDNESGYKLYDMYTKLYLRNGMDLSADSWGEMKSKYKASWLIDLNKDDEADAFIIYRETKFGNRICLLGSNDVKYSKSKLLEKTIELLDSDGWYIEASLKIEDILRLSNVNHVESQDDIVKIIPKAKVMGNGYYKRRLNKVNKEIVKRIYGNPIL